MAERKPYPSDLSDEAWDLIRPVLTAWKARHPSASGHEGGYDMREIVNAVLYQARTGCQWRYLPHDLPPTSAVYYYFGQWRDDGTTETIHDLLRWLVREHHRRKADPSAVVLDSQTVRSSTNAPKGTTGLDPGKKSPGRKRGIAVDTLGLLIAVVVVAASVHDNTIGTALLDRVAAAAPPVRKAWVDAGFKTTVVEHGAGLGIDVEVVGREPGARGFTPLPKRWRVEQTLGTLMLHRRLARDYEAKPASAVAMIHWSMVEVMARRLTGAATPTWRDPPV
ncbi:IS5 family transposase [Frankia casuarinae]|jgi:transposase|uniref:Transposase, IS4 family n=9 Tax=Bacillati TaxID=1783272 RepID=Q2JBD1_FRACC|nr:IS5 family transposase [Frankia casuarinae]ABD10489.1 transposase, IS4 family [Frankia casuarinae]ABD11411.1 transposase, IS4 family [Frankia casuarinae]ABD11904.1 transposase, IS4 family [Frankia casuarinae]ABD12068.1 transposase, IS4 family [Frankia casuarinae]ABD13356.1 transposase, IS4 family [Frankia casuarinae]